MNYSHFENGLFMISSLMFYLIFAVLSFVFLKNKKEKTAMYILSFVYICLFSFNLISSDAKSYRMIYDEIRSQNLEYFFQYTIYIFNTFDLNFHIYLLFIALINIFLLIKISKYSKINFVNFMVVFATFNLYYSNLNTIRASLATLFFVYIIVNPNFNKMIKYLLFPFLILFHYSSVVLIVLYICRKVKFNLLKIFFILLVSFLLSTYITDLLIFLSGTYDIPIFNKLIGYQAYLSEREDMGIYLLIIFSLGLLYNLYARYKINKYYNILIPNEKYFLNMINMSILFFFVIWIMISIDFAILLAGRVATMVSLLSVVLLAKKEIFSVASNMKLFILMNCIFFIGKI